MLQFFINIFIYYKSRGLPKFENKIPLFQCGAQYSDLNLFTVEKSVHRLCEMMMVDGFLSPLV